MDAFNRIFLEMKFSGRRTLFIACLLMAGACNQKADENRQLDSTEAKDSSTEALYNQVMDIHDEVMPKMDDLYKAKTTLQTRLNLPGVAQTEKEEIKGKIARLDSASEGMMVWMRQFQPLPDNAAPDSAQAYLEEELVKVKKVREDIHKALESAQ